MEKGLLVKTGNSIEHWIKVVQKSIIEKHKAIIDFLKSEQGAEVIGISSDSEDSHKMFSEKYKLPYKLLSDNEGKVRKLYDVPKTMIFYTVE